MNPFRAFSMLFLHDLVLVMRCHLRVCIQMVSFLQISLPKISKPIYLLLYQTPPSVLCDCHPPCHVNSVVCSLFHNSFASCLPLFCRLSFMTDQLVGLFLASILSSAYIWFFDVKMCSPTFLCPCCTKNTVLALLRVSISWMSTAPDCVVCFSLCFPLFPLAL